jgi:hypothetical protein
MCVCNVYMKLCMLVLSYRGVVRPEVFVYDI